MKKTRPLGMTYCIHSFMSEELDLGGGELLIFAIIYSFSKGDEGLYYGTQSYLSRSSGLSISTVKRSLSSLLRKRYIEECSYGERKGYKTTSYAEPKACEEDTGPDNEAEEMLLPAAKMAELKIDIRDCLSEGIERPKYEFHAIGKDGCVHMTAEQYQRLLKLVGAEVLSSYVRRLELLMKNRGYRTFSPYKTIKKWIYEDAAV